LAPAPLALLTLHGGKFATSIKDTGGKFAAGVNDS
jgi:hypothetical protein